LALAGYGLLIATLIQNAFALPIVREQSDRGHVLVDTGFYAHVRHPFYVGFIVFLAGLPLWLESYAGVLALPIVLIALVARIVVEEKTLRDTLPGYAEYMTRVRYRLIPLIW
jgi:protein-S-isoprenylcysteine O-methyltransferase Ste14